MPTLSLNVGVSGLGVAITQRMVRSSDGGGVKDPVIPKGYAGQLTTRTDANTGTVTLAGGHAITTGQKVDIYWSGGVQYNVTVGTVATNSMPFDLGIGDNLPTNLTNVVVSPRKEVTADIDGDALSLLAIRVKHANQQDNTTAGHADFHDAANDEIAELDLPANAPKTFDISGGAANPFAGDPITKLFVSQASTTADAKLELAWLQDSTP